MARPEQLPYGAISPTSQPVSTFIQPKNQALMGQPSQPAQFGNPKGLQLQGTGGTTMVQGENPFTALARSLKPFSEQLTAAAQNGGLAYAGWQMDLGEQAAAEQVAEAGARLDEETETAELNRAAANRSVAMKDPAAGQIMNLLNPYRQIGWKRGMSKRAGQEILYGMGDYVRSQSDRIDYTAPDQGFAALQEIRAEYTNQVLDKYGIDRGAPGFAKYTAPKIDKASEQVAQTLQTDRVKFFDDQKPRQAAALLVAEWELAEQSGGVTYNGQFYSKPSDPNSPEAGLYRAALSGRLNQIANNELMTAGLPGQASKWQKAIYQRLAAKYSFEGAGDSPLNYLTTQQPMKTADGTTILDARGNPRMYSWKELYQQEDIDADIKYRQAAYTANNNAFKQLSRELQGALIPQLIGLEGPERIAVGNQLFQKYLDDLKSRGIPVSYGLQAELYKAFSQALTISQDIGSSGADPNFAATWISGIQGGVGPFDGAKARRELAGISLSVPEAERPAFIRRATEAINTREESNNVESDYKDNYDPIVTGRVDELIAKEYPREKPGNKAEIISARGQLTTLYNQTARRAIQAEATRLERRLTPTEAENAVIKALDGIKPDAIEGFFGPNSKTNRTSGAEKPEAEKPAAQPSSSGTESKPVPIAATYTLQGLNNIPSRRVVLRQYKTTRILDSSAIEEAVDNGYMSYDQPSSLRRAWRDAGAPSLFDFVNQQYQLLLKQVPNYEPSWTPAKWTRFKNQSLRSAGFEHSVNAFNSLNQSRPRLASIQGSMANIFIGA